MKAVHISVVAMIAAVAAVATALITHDSEALITSVLALVTVFLPAVQLVLPWFHQPSVKGDMPVLTDTPMKK